MVARGLDDLLTDLVAGTAGGITTPAPDAPVRQHVLAAIAHCWAGDYPACREAAALAALQAHDPLDRMLALDALAMASAGIPELADAVDWEDGLQQVAALDLGGDGPADPTTRWAQLAAHLFVDAALSHGRLDVAARQPAAVADVWRQWEAHPYQLVMATTQMRVLLFLGSVSKAQELTAALDRIAEQHDLLPVLDGIQVVLAGVGDRPDAVHRLVDQLLTHRLPPVGHIGRGVHLLAAYGAAAIGDVHGAAAMVQIAGGGPELERLAVVDRGLAIELLVAAACADGDVDAARSWLAHSGPLLHHRGAQPALDRARARTALLAGDVAEAIRLAERSLLLARRERRAIEAADAEVLLARARVAARDVAGAVRTLRAGVELSDAGGHRAMRRASAGVLRGTGRRLPPASAAGWEVLSPREREIAELILSGLDHDELVARLQLASATVRVHVSRVLHAFGVNSRVGLLALLGPRGGPWPSPPAPLTPRQRQVVGLVATGMDNQGIAAELGVGIKVVEKHVTDALRRWGCGSRFDLAARWLQQQSGE